MHATTEELLKGVFSVRSVPRLYNEDQLLVMNLEETETKNDCAGESQQKFNRPTGHPSAWGYNWATLFLGDKYGDLALQVGGVSNLRQ
jgi:hypothetical protein